MREGDNQVLQILQDAIKTKYPVSFEFTNTDNITRIHTVEPAAVVYRWQDENGISDLSKLTREQVAELRKMERDHEQTIMQMGGAEQYESVLRIGESFDYLIRIANGQMSNGLCKG